MLRTPKHVRAPTLDTTKRSATTDARKQEASRPLSAARDWQHVFQKVDQRHRSTHEQTGAWGRLTGALLMSTTNPHKGHVMSGPLSRPPEALSCAPRGGLGALRQSRDKVQQLLGQSFGSLRQHRQAFRWHLMKRSAGRLSTVSTCACSSPCQPLTVLEDLETLKKRFGVPTRSGALDSAKTPGGRGGRVPPASGGG